MNIYEHVGIDGMVAIRKSLLDERTKTQMIGKKRWIHVH